MQSKIRDLMWFLVIICLLVGSSSCLLTARLQNTSAPTSVKPPPITETLEQIDATKTPPIIETLEQIGATKTPPFIEPLEPIGGAKTPPLIESLGQIGGAINAIAAQGSYLYVSVGQRVMVLDIASPASPKMVGQTIMLSDQVIGMAISGDILYAAAGMEGIRIFDISDPTSPKEINAIPTASETNNVSVAGNLLLSTDKGRLRIFDLTNPVSPSEVGMYLFTCGEVWIPSFTSDGNYVYLPGNSYRMEIISIADPASPTLVGSFNAPPPSTRRGTSILDFILVDGQYAYAMYDSSGLSIIDISDPTQPIDVGWEGPWGRAVAVSNPYIYIGGSEGIRIFDVSDPAQLVLGDTIGSDIKLMHMGDGYLYASDGMTLYFWELTNPLSPELKGKIALSLFSSPNDLVLSGDNLYVLEFGGLTILDMSMPELPVPISSYPLSYPPREIAINGIYLYIISNGLLILDASDPSHPIEIGSYQSPGCAADLAISDGFVYIADCSGGLRVVDASNPTKPVEVGVFQTQDVFTVDVQGNVVYLPIDRGGFMVLDVSDPKHPTEVGYYHTPGNPIANDIVVVGDYAYVSEVANAVRVYDISDPAMPYDTSLTGMEGLNGMAIQDQYLYVSNYEGVLVFDISDPTEPRQVGFRQVPGLIDDISISGNLMVVTEFLNGVGLLRLLREKETDVISPAGGYLDAASGNASFNVPAGSFADTVELTYRHLFYDEPSVDLLAIGRTFELTAVYSCTDNVAPLADGQVIAMTLNYSEAEIGPAIEDTLALYFWDGSEWVRESSGQLNTEDNLINATVNHLGLWAILGER